jgi:hypothetical protein
MNGEHALLLVIGLWWHANRKNRRSLAHNFTYPEVVELARSGKLVLNTTGQGETMQVAGTIQGSTQVRPHNGNGNGGNTRRVFVPPGRPPQQQPNPQSQSRRTHMPDNNEQGSTTQVIAATITQEDVGKTVRVAASDIAADLAPMIQPTPQPLPPDPLAEMRAAIEALKRQNMQLQQDLAASKDLRRGVGLTIKMTDKGGVSVYGLGRFPITLYGQQWRKVLDPTFVRTMTEFIDNHTLVQDGGKLVEGTKDASGAPIPHLTYQYPGQK